MSRHTMRLSVDLSDLESAALAMRRHAQAAARAASYRFVSDPGHGWLVVPLSTIDALGIGGRFTVYSYKDDAHAYLEEDCDASVFIDALGLPADQEARSAWFHDHVRERHINRPCFVRDLEPYR